MLSVSPCQPPADLSCSHPFQQKRRHVAAENNTDTSQIKATRFPNTRSASRIQNSEKTLKSKNQRVFDRVTADGRVLSAACLPVEQIGSTPASQGSARLATWPPLPRSACRPLSTRQGSSSVLDSFHGALINQQPLLSSSSCPNSRLTAQNSTRTETHINETSLSHTHTHTHSLVSSQPEILSFGRRRLTLNARSRAALAHPQHSIARQRSQYILSSKAANGFA
ncbi:uncharacterized protein UDID_17322 [Ustilago sp. UG-2017a]|nr:uncharacterized protein UDID_17322 [Ustilago sp. UG-2017a]